MEVIPRCEQVRHRLFHPGERSGVARRFVQHQRPAQGGEKAVRVLGAARLQQVGGGARGGEAALVARCLPQQHQALVQLCEADEAGSTSAFDALEHLGRPGGRLDTDEKNPQSLGGREDCTVARDAVERHEPDEQPAVPPEQRHVLDARLRAREAQVRTTEAAVRLLLREELRRERPQVIARATGGRCQCERFEVAARQVARVVGEAPHGIAPHVGQDERLAEGRHAGAGEAAARERDAAGQVSRRLPSTDGHALRRVRFLGAGRVQPGYRRGRTRRGEETPARHRGGPAALSIVVSSAATLPDWRELGPLSTFPLISGGVVLLEPLGVATLHDAGVAHRPAVHPVPGSRSAHELAIRVNMRD